MFKIILHLILFFVACCCCFSVMDVYYWSIEYQYTYIGACMAFLILPTSGLVLLLDWERAGFVSLRNQVQIPAEALNIQYLCQLQTDVMKALNCPLASGNIARSTSLIYAPKNSWGTISGISSTSICHHIFFWKCPF